MKTLYAVVCTLLLSLSAFGQMAITSVSPAQIQANLPATLTVSGSGFLPGTIVSFNGTALVTTYLSDTSLSADVPASLATAGSRAITASFSESAAPISVSVVACGPPSYSCSRSDLNAAALPNPLPNMGDPLNGCNAQWTDPNFGTTNIRATCAGTRGAKFSFTMGDGGDGNWTNPDTSMVIMKTPVLRIFSFDGNAFTPTPITFPGQDAQFLKNDPTGNGLVILNTFQGQLKIMRGVVNRSTWTLSTSLIRDLALMPGCGLPQPFKTTWSGTFGIADDDDTLSFSVSNTGGQESGTYVLKYVISKDVCRVLHTDTGVVTASAGPVGGIGPSLRRCTLHGSAQSPNPAFISYSHNMCTVPTPPINTGGPSFWESDTLNVRDCGTDPQAKPYCDGHGAQGYSGMFKGKNYCMHPYTSPNTPGACLLNAGWPAFGDQHGTNNHNNATDSLPVFLVSTDVAHKVAAYSVPFYGEVVGFSTDGTNTPHREAQVMNSFKSQIFDCANNIGKISMDGKWLLYAGDGLGSFGSTSGAAACTLGVDCRCDVIAVKLK